LHTGTEPITLRETKASRAAPAKKARNQLAWFRAFCVRDLLIHAGVNPMKKRTFLSAVVPGLMTAGGAALPKGAFAAQPGGQAIVVTTVVGDTIPAMFDDAASAATTA
jgi:hypothetical protein